MSNAIRRRCCCRRSNSSNNDDGSNDDDNKIDCDNDDFDKRIDNCDVDSLNKNPTVKTKSNTRYQKLVDNYNFIFSHPKLNSDDGDENDIDDDDMEYIDNVNNVAAITDSDKCTKNNRESKDDDCKEEEKKNSRSNGFSIFKLFERESALFRKDGKEYASTLNRTPNYDDGNTTSTAIIDNDIIFESDIETSRCARLSGKRKFVQCFIADTVAENDNPSDRNDDADCRKSKMPHYDTDDDDVENHGHDIADNNRTSDERINSIDMVEESRHANANATFATTLDDELKNELKNFMPKSVLQEILSIREMLYVDFDPYQRMVDLMESESAIRANIPLRLRHLNLSEIEFVKALPDFMRSLVSSKTLKRAYRDTAFVMSIFTYIFSLFDFAKNSTSHQHLIETNSFLKSLANHVGSFVDECISSTPMSSNAKVSPLFSHPLNRNYAIFPTAFKFLLQWTNESNARQERLRQQQSPLIMDHAADDYFLEKLRRIVDCFVRERWTVDDLNLLRDTSNSPLMRHVRGMCDLDVADRDANRRSTIKYVMGTACCGKTTMLSVLSKEKHYATPSRSSLGLFGGKRDSPALVASLHSALDYTYRAYADVVFGDRGPLDNYIWTFIMPMIGKISRAATYNLENVTNELFKGVLEFFNETLNELSYAYHASNDVVVFVDPFHSKTQERMLLRNMDFDQHRGRIPNYALVQNVAYALLAHLFEYTICPLTYDLYEGNSVTSTNGNNVAVFTPETVVVNFKLFEEDIRERIISKYPNADETRRVEFVRLLQNCILLPKCSSASLLCDFTYQQCIGIHK